MVSRWGLVRKTSRDTRDDPTGIMTLRTYVQHKSISLSHRHVAASSTAQRMMIPFTPTIAANDAGKLTIGVVIVQGVVDGWTWGVAGVIAAHEEHFHPVGSFKQNALSGACTIITHIRADHSYAIAAREQTGIA